MNNYIYAPEIKPSGYYNGGRYEMLRFVPLNVTRVLEVGCGAGNFASNLKSERKIEVWGVEISKVIAAQAAEKLDKVIVGDFENGGVILPQNYFDCIIFNDVLEHFKYPWIVLKKSADYLTNGGYIVSSIPNIRYFDVFKDYLLNKEWKYSDDGILDKIHLRFFTLKSISDMFKHLAIEL